MAFVLRKDLDRFVGRRLLNPRHHRGYSGSSLLSCRWRGLTIRDMLRSKPVTTGQLDFIKENSFTNAASPHAEGSAKGESADTFVIGPERIRTLAHWIPLSKQVVDDVPELRRFIDEVLIYGAQAQRGNGLLSGDDLGDHLNGIIPQATAYAGHVCRCW